MENGQIVTKGAALETNRLIQELEKLELGGLLDKKNLAKLQTLTNTNTPIDALVKILQIQNQNGEELNTQSSKEVEKKPLGEKLLPSLNAEEEKNIVEAIRKHCPYISDAREECPNIFFKADKIVASNYGDGNLPKGWAVLFKKITGEEIDDTPKWTREFEENEERRKKELETSLLSLLPKLKTKYPEPQKIIEILKINQELYSAFKNAGLEGDVIAEIMKINDGFSYEDSQIHKAYSGLLKLLYYGRDVNEHVTLLEFQKIFNS